jgi:Undecaprenyl-phosphate glucose phosphotransferase
MGVSSDRAETAGGDDLIVPRGPQASPHADAVESEEKPGMTSVDEPQDGKDGPQAAPSDLLSQRRRRAHHAWLFLRLALFAADAATIIFAPLLLSRPIFAGQPSPRGEPAMLALTLLIAIMALHVCKAYDRAALRHPLQAVKAVAVAWMGTTAAVLTITLSAQSGLHPLNPLLTPAWIITASMVMLQHLVMNGIVARLMENGYLRERIVLVGADGTRSEHIIRQVIGSGSNEITILGLFDDRVGRVVDHVEGFPVLGDTNSLVAYVRNKQVDRVILSLPWTAEKRVLGLISKLRQLPVRIDLLPHNLIWGFHTDIGRIAGIPVITVANQRVDAQLGMLKRTEDILVGSLFVLALAPVFLIVALAVKMSSPGPVLFRQKRYGFNNEVFSVYKFRSMYFQPTADNAVTQASRGDARVTRVGRILRRTSLDELPQFFNVLEGTMSIVGPRPHAIPHNIEYGQIIDEYYARHNVKPGITGWAQVNGYRGETDTPDKMRKRVEFDLYYIDNWSLSFDIKVILLTAFRIWFQNTAY